MHWGLTATVSLPSFSGFTTDIEVPLEMRLTCLKCGHQFQVSVVDAQLEGYGYCLCGTEHVFPDVITPGIFPSDRAAEI